MKRFIFFFAQQRVDWNVAISSYRNVLTHWLQSSITAGWADRLERARTKFEREKILRILFFFWGGGGNLCTVFFFFFFLPNMIEGGLPCSDVRDALNAWSVQMFSCSTFLSFSSKGSLDGLSIYQTTTTCSQERFGYRTPERKKEKKKTVKEGGWVQGWKIVGFFLWFVTQTLLCSNGFTTLIIIHSVWKLVTNIKCVIFIVLYVKLLNL